MKNLKKTIYLLLIINIISIFNIYPCFAKENNEYVKLEKYKFEDIEDDLQASVQTYIREFINNKLSQYPCNKPIEKNKPNINDYVQIGVIGYADNSDCPFIEKSNCIYKLGSGVLPKVIEDKLLTMECGTIDTLNLISNDENENLNGHKITYMINLINVVEPIIYNYDTISEGYVTETFNVKNINDFYYQSEKEALQNEDIYKSNALNEYLLKNADVKITEQMVSDNTNNKLKLDIQNDFFGNTREYIKYIEDTKQIPYYEYKKQLKEEMKDETKKELIYDFLYRNLGLKRDKEEYESFLWYLSDKKGLNNTADIEKYYETPQKTGKENIDRMFNDIQVLRYYNENFKIKLTNIEPEDPELHKWTINKEITLNQSRNFKSFMDYRTITSKTSNQYKLQQIAESTYDGFRTVDDCYCIAVGTAVGAKVGQYVDIILKNDMTIKCIVGDIKADKDTESNNIYTSLNGCCSEFIVDKNYLSDTVLLSGNVSNHNELWDSPVKEIVVYEECKNL